MRCISASQWKTRRKVDDEKASFELSGISSGEWAATPKKPVTDIPNQKREIQTNKKNLATSYDVAFIFEHLWMKAVVDLDGNKIAPTGCTGVKLMDTVLFKGGYPAAWYFQSKIDCRILRKKYESLHVPKIVEAFCADGGSSDQGVVAMYVGTKKMENGPLNSVTYYDRKQLKEFLLSENTNMPDGFLQRFVAPESKPMESSTRNSTLHVSWSPYHCSVENLVNMSRLGPKGSLTSDKVNIAFNNVENCTKPFRSPQQYYKSRTYRCNVLHDHLTAPPTCLPMIRAPPRTLFFAAHPPGPPCRQRPSTPIPSSTRRCATSAGASQTTSASPPPTTSKSST